jgi:hypothetical protein
VASLARCGDPIDAPSAFSAERCVCGPEHAAEFDALVEECRTLRQTDVCGGVLSMRGSIDSEDVVMDARVSSATPFDWPGDPGIARTLELLAASRYFNVKLDSYVESEAYRGAAGTDLVLTLSPWFSVTTGGQLNLEQIKGAFVHPNVDGQSRPSYGFYAGLKAQPLDVLDLTLTGRGDQSPISARLEYSARASAVYHRSTWGVRLTAATAFRSPTYVEAAGRFVDPANNQILLEGNASLEAPRNTSLELGTTFSPNPDFTLSGTLYWSRLTRLMIEDSNRWCAGASGTTPRRTT